MVLIKQATQFRIFQAASVFLIAHLDGLEEQAKYAYLAKALVLSVN